MAIRCGCCGDEHATPGEVRACCAGAAPLRSTAPAPITVRDDPPEPAVLRDLALLAGPDLLGRSLVVRPAAAVPPPWDTAPRVTIDGVSLADPAALVAELRPRHLRRERLVIELAEPFDAASETEPRAPHLLGPGYELPLGALHHLVWTNSVDARDPGRPRWPWADRAAALGAQPGGPADVVLADGTAAWCDGGPLQHRPELGAVLHRIGLEHGSLAPLGANETAVELADDQLAAVTHPGGGARIIAPAGSGKTRVLTERARLLLDGWKLPPGGVWLVAFNKRAQEEMEARTTDLAALRVRTLNSLGLAIVNGDRPFAPRPRRLTTIDEREVRGHLSRLVKLPRRRNVDPMATWIEALGMARLGLRKPSEVERHFGDDVPDFARVYDAYRAELGSRGLVDFDEQILTAIELLLTDAEARAAAQRACRLLLVDEFQDLTPAHLLLVRLLAAPAYEVFGVGDDDQTIYGYNGADPTWLIEYERFFPGAADHPLEVNYRCPQGVVAAADTLLRHNVRRVPKAIRAAKAGARGWSVVEADDAPGAAVHAVTTRLEQGAAPGDIAVLARVNVVLAPVQVALAERGVPLRGAVGPELLERTAVRATMSWLRLATGPWSPEDLQEVLRRPSRSLSPRVGEWVTEQGDLASLRRLAGRLHAERDADHVGELADDLESLGRLATRQPLTVVLDHLFDRIGLAPAVSSLDRTRHGINATAQADDVDALRWLARLHPGIGDFEAWLRAALSQRRAVDGVTLASVHKVKGQEWPHVVVHHVDAAQFPHRLADDREEERRVFHVAITRAIESVTIIATDTPSPFVAELTSEPPERPVEAPAGRVSSRPRSTGKITRDAKDTRVLAAPGLVLVDQGQAWRITDVHADGAVAVLGTATRRFASGALVATQGGRKGPLTTPSAGDADAPTIVLADGLRALRRALSDGKPAYTVFDDKTLDAIATARPRTLADLGRIKGIGPAKLTSYGPSILGAVEEALASG